MMDHLRVWSYPEQSTSGPSHPLRLSAPEQSSSLLQIERGECEISFMA